jgi:hypothetical protein
MLTSGSIVKISSALVKAQAEMPLVPMNTENPFYHSKFADLGSVIKTTRPVLAKNGLAISQWPTTSGDGQVGLTTRLIHESGEWLEDTVFIKAVPEQKNPAQAAGITITYLKRYCWSAVLGIYTDEDTDGERLAKDSEPELTEEEKELKKLKKLIVTVGKELGGKENQKVVELIKEYDETGNPNNINNIGVAKSLLAKLNLMTEQDEYKSQKENQ